MRGGPFDGARFTHSYTPLGDQTKVDLEGDFPSLPGMSEAEELGMIDGFFSGVFAEDMCHAAGVGAGGVAPDQSAPSRAAARRSAASAVVSPSASALA